MKIKILKPLILSLLLFLLVLNARATDYYWVGGTGAWHEYATHWATSSGGITFHTAPPDQNSSVFFDQNSFPAGPPCTVTVGDPNIFCHDMIWVNIPTNTTFTCGANINISGSLIYASNMHLLNNSGVTTFISGTAEIINSGGAINPLKNVTFNGNGTWTLLNYLNVDNDITLDKGVVITGSNDLMCSKFISTPAILTNLRVLDLGNSVFNIKSANNIPYLSWNVDNSMGTFHIVNQGNSLIHFLAQSGLSTMHAGTGVVYNDVEFDGDGRMEVDLDTIHNSTFHGNGEIIGDSNVMNDVQCDIYGMINGHNNIFHDVNIDDKGDIGNLSLSGRDVDHNRFNIVSIGNEGHVYGDYNMFLDLLFSTSPDWPCPPDMCCYAGPTDPGYLYGNNDTVYRNLVFHREAHIFGGSNYFYDATFWCDAWVLQGSNEFFNLNLYRHYQECFSSFQGIVPLSVHSNVLTLQSDSTQYLWDGLNLLGNIYCEHTHIKSSSPTVAANLNSDSVLVLDYIRLTYIHSANTPNISDTATRSEDNGGNFFWDFNTPYANIAQGDPTVIATSPCYGDCNGKVFLNPNGGVPPYAYSSQIWMPGFNGIWTGLQDTNLFSGLCSVNYPFLVVDFYGCLLPFHVPVPSPPMIDTNYVTVKPINCFGETNGSIMIVAHGGTGALSYSIDAGLTYQDSNTFYNLAAGFYTIRVRDAVGCYRDFGLFHIIEPNILTLTTGGQSTIVKCHADSTALVIAIPGGGTPPYTYDFAGPFSAEYAQVTINTTQDTLYGHGGYWYVTVTDAHGCVATDLTQREDPSPIVVGVTVTSYNNCADTNSFVLHGTVTGGNFPFIGYNWYDSANNWIGIGLTHQFVSLGTYTLVAENIYHCKDSAYKTIDVLHDSITYLKNKSCKGSSSNDGAICVTGLKGSAAYTYAWNMGSISQCIGGIDTGLYIVTVTDAQYGCKVIDSITITQPDSLLSISLYADSTSCNGLLDGLARVFASGGTPPYVYQWTGNTGLATNDTIIGQAAGLYFVKVTDSLGCSITGSVNIYSPPPGQVQFDSGYYCNPQGYWAQAMVTGGTLPYSYNWNPSYGSITDVVVGPAGTYTVTVTDGNGCPYLGSVDLFPYEILFEQHNALCYHDSSGWAKVTVSHGNPPYAYQWFRAGTPAVAMSSTTATQTGMNAGDYFVVVQDLVGCSDTTFFSITEPSAPVDITIQMNSDNNLCFTDCKGFGVATTQGGVWPYTYSWTGPNTYTSTLGIISNLCAGVYHVTVTDKNGCVMVGFDTITSAPELIFDSIVVVPPACNMAGYTGSATVYVHGGSGTYKFRLDGGTLGTASVFSNLTAGAHNIQVVDFYGCFKNTSFVVPMPLALNVTINTLSVPLSFTGIEGSLGTTVVGGTPGYTYEWTTGAMTSGISGLGGGMYCVTVTDAHACVTTNCKVLASPGQLVMTVTSQDVVCHGDDNGVITAGASGGVPPYMFSISPNVPWTGSNPRTYANLAPGTYIITINDNNGITQKDTVFITEPNAYSLNINHPDSICPGTLEGWAEAIITGNTPYNIPPYYNFVWSGGTIVTPNQVNGLAPGTYQVSITDSRACPISGSFVIFPYDKPLAVFTQPASICLGNTVTLTNSSSVLHSTLVKATVNWGDGPDQVYFYPIAGMQHLYASPGSYTITMSVTDANQCMSLPVSHTVNVLPIPDAIISYDTACFGNPTHLTDLSVNSNTPGTWIVDGLTLPYQTSIAPVMDHWGLVTVKLIVQNVLNCRDSLTVLVPVDSLPHPNFAFHDSICVGGMVRFTDLSLPNGSSIQHHQWSFGDGYGSVLTNPLHDFLQTNVTYPVTLTVTSQRGCSDSLMIPVLVSLPFTLGMTADTVCLGAASQFTGIALTPPGDNLLMQYWYFGDGNSSLAINPAHQYANPGTYIAVLMAVDQNGCQEMVFDSNVVVYPLPTAAFTYQINCQSYTVDFTSTSQFLTASGNLLEWTFETGGIPVFTTNSFTQHTYPGPGTYQVRLVVFNGNSCTDTIFAEVNLDPPLIPDFSFDQACAGGELHFQDQTQITPTAWLWNFGTIPATTDSVANPVHSFPSATAYTVQLTAYDVNHCAYTISRVVNMLPLPVAAFTTLPLYNCQQDSVHFSDESTTANGSIISWKWNFGDAPSGNSNLSNLQNPTHYYNQANSYPVSLVIQTNAGNGCTDTVQQAVLVRPSPIAGFNATSSCFGDTTLFTNTSIPVNASTLQYSWNFGEPASGSNNLALTKNPKHKYAAPGTYLVTLTVTDEFSCPDSIKIQVVVLPLPVAAFSHGTLCLNNPVQFTNLTNPGAGTTIAWNWNFGDPQSMSDSVSTLTNPTHTFVATGPYVITLIVTTSNGCKDTVTTGLVIPASPIANFAAQDTCLGTPTNFQDLSNSANGAINSWTWDFGDTQSSSIANPTHVYPLSGTFNVVLTVKDAAQCIGSVSKPVYVHALPAPDFYATIYCTDNPVNFVDLSNGSGFPITSWNWNFGDPGNPPNTDTLQNPAHTYTAQNFYNVTLQVENLKGCVNSLTQPILVPTGAVADFEITSPDTCTGNVVNFHDLSYSIGSTVVSWYWDFGNSVISTAKNPSVTFYSSGLQQVSLTITTALGCTKTIVKVFMVNPLPNVVFNYPTPLCDGSPVLFSGIAASPGSTGVFTWQWKMGYNNDQSNLQNPLPYTYPDAGTYSVELTVTDSHHCKNTYIEAVAIHPSPVADFTSILIHPPCNNRKVCFTDNTDWTTAQAASWLWSFGDAPISGTAVLPNPCYTYAADGNYNVTLQVMNTYGCGGQITKSIPVFPPQGPVAGFTVPLPAAGVHCYGDNTQFTNTTVTTGGSIISWDWNFGDAASGLLNVDTLASPTHLFSHPGTYTVSLTVTDVNSCISSISWPVTVNATPIAGFTNDLDCQGTLISFSDTSLYNGQPASRNWLIDGVGAGTVTPMQHLFTTTANHNIQLSVMNQAGCSAVVSKTLFVFPAPTAAFTIQPASACVNSAISFNASASVANFGPGLTYSWNFGDNSTSTAGPLTSHTYTIGANYTPGLVVTNSHGCMDTLTQPVQVRVLPLPSFTVTSSTCLYDSVHFQAASTTPNGAIQTWSWYFDHGAPNAYATVKNPVHQFPVSPAGPYHVELTVYDGYCSNVIIDTIAIDPLPTAAFTADIACFGSPTHFTDQSATSNGIITNWTWFRGANQFSTAQNPAPVMPQQGLIAVTLKIQDSKLCKNQITHNVAVDSLPIPSFSWGDTCTPGVNAGQVQFHDLSNPNSGTISAWSWQFPQGNMSSLQHPMHTFSPVNQTYPVSLTITRRGCQATATNNVLVKPAFAVDFTYQQACFGNPATFIPTVIAPLNTPHGSWSWKFGDGLIGISATDITHSYAQTGSYYAQVTTTSSAGCTDSTGHLIEVFPLPQPIFTYDTTACFELTQFTNLSLPGSGSLQGQSWDFGDGSPVSTTNNPAHAFAPSGGSWWVKLTVSNSDGCSKADSLLVIHLPCGNAGFTMSSGLMCTGTTMTFTDTTSLGGNAVFVDRVWNFGNVAPPSHASPVSVIYTTAGTYTVSLVVTFQANNIVFTDTATQQFTIYNTPVAQFQTASVCFGGDVQLVNQSNIVSGSFTNQWDFGYPGGTSTLQNPPLLHYTAPGDYTASLIVVSDHNCSDTVSHVVHIWPIPVAAFTADPISICGIPAEVTFSDQSTGNIQQTIWDFDYGFPVNGGPGDQIMIYNAYGVYSPSLIVVTDQGCRDTIAHPGLIKVLMKPEPMFTINPDPVSILQPTVQFTNQTFSPGNYYCSWNFGDNTGWFPGNCNPSYTYADTGTYLVSLYVKDQNGCDSSLTQPLLVFGEMTVYVPNAFTPDGDGLNDVFGPTGAYLNPDGYLLTIYTRWGEEIFSTDDPAKGWDGKLRNTDVIVQLGAYVYYIRVKDLKGSVQEFKGYVILLRKE